MHRVRRRASRQVFWLTDALSGPQCGNKNGSRMSDRTAATYGFTSLRKESPMASAQGGSRLGTRFGPYELHELIGMGGMGEVYRAFDTTKERMVALKVLRADMAADTSYQARFRRES